MAEPEVSRESLHPCQKCGACCASFRVAFLKTELQLSSTSLRLRQSVCDLGGAWVAMQGTEVKHRPACQQLQGKIGERVSCEIYIERPSPCRNFTASFERGIKSDRCDEARKRHGLPPLQQNSWVSVKLRGFSSIR